MLFFVSYKQIRSQVLHRRSQFNITLYLLNPSYGLCYFELSYNSCSMNHENSNISLAPSDQLLALMIWSI